MSHLKISANIIFQSFYGHINLSYRANSDLTLIERLLFILDTKQALDLKNLIIL